MSHDSIRIDALAPRLMQIGGAVGVVSLGASVALGLTHGDDGQHFWHSYLFGWAYFLSISLGALFFVILQHLTRAGWSVVFRRMAELFAANLPTMVVLFLPILGSVLMGNTKLYSWVNHDMMVHEAALTSKIPYLNVPFFAVRFCLYAAVWIFFSLLYLRRSLAQDVSGDPRITMGLQSISPIGMMLFALSLTFGAFDWLMSLDPHWFSTMFGVYFFAGSVLAFFSTLALFCMVVQKSGALNDHITTEHYHDLGKFTFGFVFFWGYVAFSQYMLIWYGNIPEETSWYLVRQTGDWVWLTVALLFGHFLIPFPGLMSRHIKRRGATLGFWATFLLIMHAVDLYWLIMPSLGGDTVPFSILDITCWLGIGGIYIASFGYLAKGTALVPLKDPRLAESLAFENA